MRLSRWTIYVVITAAALAMAGLLYVQVEILSGMVTMYKKQFDLLVPSYLSEMQEQIRSDRHWVDAVNNYTEQDSFLIRSFERDPDEYIFSELKHKIDSVFRLKNLEIDYEIRGLIAGGTRCFYYQTDSAKRANPWINMVVNNSDDHHSLCLCGPDVGESHGQHGMGEYTAFDISIGYPNQMEAFVGVNAKFLRITVLFLVIVILAFAYTVLTINKQKKLSALKNDFINNLTHEFKTPIFSISLASGLLKKSEEVKQSERLTSYAELIDNEGQRLKSQVDKILQMALIDSGNFKLDKKPVDIHELIRKVASSFELIVNERKGSLDLHLDANNSVIVADETHLNNIVYNLLDNAVKYTEDEPEITVTTLDSDKGITLKIKDNGIGMGEEVQKFVFDKFYRAGSGDLHNVKGFGLGLSYVKSVIEAHRGKIGINSKKNKGSEFSIFLPAS